MSHLVEYSFFIILLSVKAAFAGEGTLNTNNENSRSHCVGRIGFKLSDEFVSRIVDTTRQLGMADSMGSVAITRLVDAIESYTFTGGFSYLGFTAYDDYLADGANVMNIDFLPNYVTRNGELSASSSPKTLASQRNLDGQQ